MKKNYPVAWFRFGLLPGFGIVLYRRKIRDCIFWRVCLNRKIHCVSDHGDFTVKDYQT